MPLKNYTFTAGPNPRQADCEGNGRWEAKAASVEAALCAIVGSATFPGEMVGRFEGVFVDGVSLPGVPSGEVIQVWSNEPDVIARTSAFGGRWRSEAKKQSHFLDFPPSQMGLACEIAVTDIAKYLVPRSAIPAWLCLPAPGDSGAISNIGQIARGAVSLENRTNLHLSAQDARLRQVRSQLDVAASGTVLRDRIGSMNRQLSILNTYMHGMTAAEIVNHGTRAAANEPYHIFQSRLYLDQEVGILVNLTSFDFQDMAQFDDWLLADERWKKLLPHSKTILVTRIRAKEKAYAGVNPVQEMLWNHWNMQNVVWVRDGDFVFRFATDFPFDSSIFKSSNEGDRVEAVLREAVFKSKFSKRGTDGNATPGLRDEAHDLSLPYARKKSVHGFATVEEWMVSNAYSDGIETSIRAAARSYVDGKNMSRLPFLVLLQGMVDSSSVLNIPPGTNLLDPVCLGRYFRLIYDQESALVDRAGQTQFAELAQPNRQRRGDWVLARTAGDREVNAHFYQVVKSSAADITIRYTPASTRYPYAPLSVLRTRKITEFLPVALPPDLIARLLDDRDWKIGHPALVPVLARWELVRTYVAGNPVNEGKLSLGAGLSDVMEGDPLK